MTDLQQSRFDPTAGRRGLLDSSLVMASDTAPTGSGPMAGRVPARVLSGLVAGLVITAFFVWVTLEGSAVPESPHHVPIAVVGSPATVRQVSLGLQRGGSFEVLAVSNEAEAVELVDRRTADAIVNLDSGQLQTASAASNLTALALQQALSSSQPNLRLKPRPIVPLAPGDPTGIGLMLISLALVLGGLPSGVALAFLSRSRRPSSLADAGRRIGLIVSFSGVTALVIAGMADAILGYGGTHILTIWAWGTLLCTASMALPVALIGGVGVPGVLLAALPLLFFGVPSAPIPSPWNWQSTVFRVLGPLDPFGATTDAIRNGIFFGAASQGRNLSVLTVWAGVPLLLIAAFGWRRRNPGLTGQSA